ncbi:MAG: 50S ribosomal protein L15P [Candidatus Bathyarchaeota archaeon BA1]|nr:MAG: 50S ribosomal protein L15P [Candidatus Bathyarchaeota archaeon BA1]
MRGSRTHGYGQVGQHRKKGGKGLRRAGRHKHLWTHVIKYEPNYFGKRGFKPSRSLGKEINVINVGDLEGLAERLAIEGRLEMRGGKALIDLDKLGYDKLLGEGNVTKPILVKVTSLSEGAAKKIEEAGGQVLKEN